MAAEMIVARALRLIARKLPYEPLPIPELADAVVEGAVGTADVNVPVFGALPHIHSPT